MKTIIHLSDLHFGRVDHKRVAPLLSMIQKINPDMVVISGDFTQRAKKKEFAEAKKFIDDMGKPVFVIPGNHDIPLYNAFQRFYSPFARYTKYISEDLSPVYKDSEIALVGINSVRNFTWSSGRISKKQISNTEKILREVDAHIIKIIVCHHPFDLPISNDPLLKKHTHKVVAQSKLAMKKMAEHKVDVYLSGHLHLQQVGDTTLRYKIKNYSGLIVQAGTAISKRLRGGEPVSFNVLRIDKQHIHVEHYAGNKKNAEFSLVSTEKFEKFEYGWRKQSSHI